MGCLSVPQLPHASAVNRVSVIVPVYNEEESVPILQRELVDALQGIDYEIIFVDDGSSDQTAARIASDPHVRVLRFEKNAGQSAAVWAGLNAGNSDILVLIDGDLQNDPAAISARRSMD